MKIIGIAVLALFSLNSFANPIIGDTCGVPDRVATLESASQCGFGLGNPNKASDISAYYPGDWVKKAEVTSNGGNEYFSVLSFAGWGKIPNLGFYAISDSFWDIHDQAVVTMHIGEGNGDPDHFAWLVEKDTYTINDNARLWTLDYVIGGTGKGGGLSNLFLWGNETVTTVAEPSIVALMGLGLLGIGIGRRRKQK